MAKSNAELVGQVLQGGSWKKCPGDAGNKQQIIGRGDFSRLVAGSHNEEEVFGKGEHLTNLQPIVCRVPGFPDFVHQFAFPSR